MAVQSYPDNERSEVIRLPEPGYDGKLSFERVLRKRRSIKDYLVEPLTLAEVSQLLWAAQGITGSYSYRTAPSAGALYPLEVYLVVGDVHNLSQGIYRYRPDRHELIKVVGGDQRVMLASAAFEQDCVRESAVVVVFTAIYERTTRKYGQRGIRYVYMDLGHAAQNVYLQATSLNLGTVSVGAFDDDEIKRIMNMPGEEHPLCIMPVGRVKYVRKHYPLCQ